MRKIILFTAVGLLQWFPLSASTLSPEQALGRLERTGITRSADSDKVKLVETFSLGNGAPGIYVFDRGMEDGYLILSADDVAAPVLGYSNKGSFGKSAVSPTMRWWIGEYTRQIECAVDGGAGVYKESSLTRGEMAPVEPLLKTEWNQDAPYNDQTPVVDGKHCVTGCVATAMAQVMKRWNYPETGSGVGEATVTLKDGSTQTVRMLFNEQDFDWTHMSDTYDATSSEAEINAVAYLMKACGYAVRMNYTASESGAPTLYVAESLVKNFGYNENIQYCQRDYYTTEEWTEMVYEELAAGRPVVYGGQGSVGGHCFVCDGYEGEGFFHFNWGWGGSSDGYFLLHALNPGNLGIGANGGGFNSGQEIVRGIQPTTGEKYLPNFVQQGNMEGRAGGIIITLTAGEDGGWFNLDTKTITVDIGVKIELMDTADADIIYHPVENLQNQTLQIAYGWREISVAMPAGLKNGRYRMTLCYRISGTEEWTPVLCQEGTLNYIEFSKKGLKYTIEEVDAGSPVIAGAGGIDVIYDHTGMVLKVSENVRSLVIYGLNGMVSEMTTECLTGSVDLSRLSSGVYIIKAVADEGLQTTIKIIK